MAMTSKYGFVYKKHLTPGIETPATLEYVISNSAGNLTIGDAVYLSSGYLMGAGADQAILGILVGIVTQNGESVFKTKDAITGTITGDDTYNAAGDNVTVDKVKGVVIVDPMALFQAYATGTLTQAMVGQWFLGAVVDGTYMDGVNYTTAQGTWSVGTQDFQLIELVTTLGDGSTSTTTGLFRIGRSQLLNDVTI
jgi:hypothetical protein